MANKRVFKSAGPKMPVTDTVNAAGGRAYSLSPQHALVQLAMTGTIADTFYAKAEDQLAQVIDLVAKVDGEFVLQTAVYARERGLMKDMPALLLAVFAGRRPSLTGSTEYMAAFRRCIDTGKMLRNFVQILRSGAVGRTTIPRPVRRLIKQWFAVRQPADIFYHSVGNDPSMRDVLRMLHVHPDVVGVDHKDANVRERNALYGYLAANPKRPIEFADLPEVVRQFDAWKLGAGGGVVLAPPKGVPFELLTGVPNLTPEHWRGIATVASWTQTRMNLNTFQRHGVFGHKPMIDLLAARLRNPALIEKARPFPYQLMMAYMAAETAPYEIREALQDAMELATANVPVFDGQIDVFVDVSGSMSSPVTGVRQGGTSKVRCVDVAALIAAVLLRKNPRTRVVPFDDVAIETRFNPRDSIMTIVAQLARYGGGGTAISAPLTQLNQRRMKTDLVFYVSDNMSWVDPATLTYYGYSSQTVEQWRICKERNPGARMVNLNIQHHGSTQAPNALDILNLGGFSDAIFATVDKFARGDCGSEVDVWVKEVEKIVLV